jgi:hypothetical protein
MSEGVGHHIALGASLQPIIANCRCRLHGGLDITGLEDAPSFRCVVSPHSRKAVGLQFNSNLKLIALGFVQAELGLLHLWQYSEQVLDVVTDLVRLRELATLASNVAAAKAALEIVEKVVSR